MNPSHNIRLNKITKKLKLFSFNNSFFSFYNLFRNIMAISVAHLNTESIDPSSITIRNCELHAAVNSIHDSTKKIYKMA
jgi:hypothetical protein